MSSDPLRWVTACSSISVAAAVASKRGGTTIRVPPASADSADTNPNVPHSGKTTNLVDAGSSSSERAAARRWRIVVLWSWAASFGRPVVPDVVNATKRS